MEFKLQLAPGAPGSSLAREVPGITGLDDAPGWSLALPG